MSSLIACISHLSKVNAAVAPELITGLQKYFSVSYLRYTKNKINLYTICIQYTIFGNRNIIFSDLLMVKSDNDVRGGGYG